MAKYWDPNKGKYVSLKDIPQMFGPKGKNVDWVDPSKLRSDAKIAKQNADRLKAAKAKAAQDAYTAKVTKKAEEQRKKAEKQRKKEEAQRKRDAKKRP